MFCICCLEGNGPYIELNKCLHADYLKLFSIPDLNPPLQQVICYHCHTTLKKINHFKCQVQESFKLLLNQAHNIKLKNRKKESIQVSKVVHLSIPDIDNEEIKNNKKISNIETALAIINNNSTSLDSLTACNFKTITETLLQATAGNLNLERILPEHKSNTLTLESMLPERKKDTLTSKTVLPEQKNCLTKDVLPSNIENMTNVGNRTVLMIKSEMDIGDTAVSLPKNNLNNINNSYLTSSVNIKKESDVKTYIEKPTNTKQNTTDNKFTQNDGNMIVLPAQIKKEPEMDIAIESIYSTAVLPDVKSEPDTTDDSFIEMELESHDSLNDSLTKNDDDSTPEKPGQSALIPITMSKEELMQERISKLLSKEYLQWPYRCDLCIIGFNYKENFHDHNKRKHEMKEGCVNCEICQQVVSKEDFKEHQGRHYNRTQQSSQVSQNIIIETGHHQDQLNTRHTINVILECEICNLRFVLFDEAFRHYRQVHVTGKVKKHLKRQVLTNYQRCKKAKHWSNTGSREDSAVAATVTDSMPTQNTSVEFANALTQDVMTKINKLY